MALYGEGRLFYEAEPTNFDQWAEGFGKRALTHTSGETSAPTVVLLRDHKEFEGVCGFSLKADATYSDSFRCYFPSLRTAVFITPSFRTASKPERYEQSSVPNLDANSCPNLD